MTAGVADALADRVLTAEKQILRFAQDDDHVYSLDWSSLRGKTAPCGRGSCSHLGLVSCGASPALTHGSWAAGGKQNRSRNFSMTDSDDEDVYPVKSQIFALG